MSEPDTSCVLTDIGKNDSSTLDIPQSSSTMTFSSAHHGIVSIIPMEQDLHDSLTFNHNKVVDLLFEMVKESSYEPLEQLLKCMPIDINTVFHTSTQDSIVTNAVIIGNIPIIELLIAHGANPSGISQSNETPFTKAVELGRFDIADLLLDKYHADFNLNLINLDGDDIFLRLIKRQTKRLDAVKYLIDRANQRFYRLNLNIRDRKSCNLLFYAHFKTYPTNMSENQELVDLLIENNADLNQPLAYRQYSFLGELCRRRDPIAYDYYKKYWIYADNNKVQWDGRKLHECFVEKISAFARSHTELNDSRLLRAIRRESYNYCYLLLLDGLTSGINIQEESTKMTALHYACKLNHVNLFVALMGRNPELHHKDIHSKTCLYYAVEANNIFMVKKLIEAKAPAFPYEKYPDCKNLLEISAVQHDNFRLTELLIRAKVDPNGISEHNPKTPLSLITEAHGNRLDYIKLFVQYSPSLASTISDAIHSGNFELLEILASLNVPIHKPIITTLSVINVQPKPITVPLPDLSSDETSRIKAQLSRSQTPPPDPIHRPQFTQPTHLQLQTKKPVVEEQLLLYTSPLSECAKLEKNHILEWFLTKTPDLKFRDKMGYTSLCYSVLYGNVHAARLIIRAGADINVTTDGGFTPLIIAIIRGNLDMVKLLIEHGADITLPETIQRLPLVVAAKYGRADIIQYLISVGCDVNCLTSKGGSPLISASKYGDVDCVKLLIEHNANLYSVNNHGNTALFTALSNSHYDAAHVIVGAGDTYLNALMVASHQGNVKVISELMSMGTVGVNDVDRDYRTALLHAAREGHNDAVQVLLEHGADINHVDQMKATALSLAVKYRRETVVKKLVDHKVDLNMQDQGSWSPLYHAIIDKHYEIASILIAAKADVNTTDQDGWNALIAALAYDAPITPIAELIAANSNVNQRDRNGLTPLMVAATRGNAEATELLLKYKADFSLQDRTGATAMKKARASTHVSSVAIQRLLKKAGSKE